MACFVFFSLKNIYKSLKYYTVYILYLSGLFFLFSSLYSGSNEEGRYICADKEGGL